MAWTRSAYPCLKPREQQLTKNRKKENYKHSSLLFRGYKHQQLKGEVSSLKCSLFNRHLCATWKSGIGVFQCTVIAKGSVEKENKVELTILYLTLELA